MLRLSEEDTFRLLDDAATALGDGGPILQALNPAPGPYALFHHLGHASERVRDVTLILRRLVDGRERLTGVNERVTAARPRDWPPGEPYPEPVATLMTEASAITHTMKVDYETLFHFGAVLLDQWAHASAYLSGVEDPAAFTFHQMMVAVEREPVRPALRPIRDQLLGHARWLHFWMRTYRNGFVVHADRPWQRGTVAGVIGTDFALFTPSPPGWEDDTALDDAIRELLPHAPQWLQDAEPGYWERARPRRLLERVVENIGRIDRQADRDRIANLARRSGLTTPTFQIVGSVLADFVGRGTVMVREAALASPTEIVLGTRT